MTDGMDRSTMHLAAGLSVGLTGLAAGYTIGVVGDAVRMHFLCGGICAMLIKGGRVYELTCNSPASTWA